MSQSHARAGEAPEVKTLAENVTPESPDSPNSSTNPNPSSTPESTAPESTTPSATPTRRSIREAAAAAAAQAVQPARTPAATSSIGAKTPTASSLTPSTRVSVKTAAVATQAAASSAVSPAFAKPAAKKAPSKGWRSFRSTAVMALVVPGLFATIAIPAYAMTPGGTDDQTAASGVQVAKETGAQKMTVDDEAAIAPVARDGYTATTSAELATARAATAVAAQRTATTASYVETASTQKTAAELLAAAPRAGLPAQADVFAAALKYQGVPYVFGGATPAGFDCSGFVLYVYAQFGISLPHSSTAQGARGTVISAAEAVPGDLLVKPGHIGFYAGNGMILHASQPGTPLRIGPMYGNYTYVRFTG